MNTLPTVVASILAALAVDLGTFDLSATDAVKEGSFSVPPTSAPTGFACLTPPELVDSEPEARDLWYLETYRAEVRVWAPVLEGTADDRSERGRLIASEVVSRLEAVRASQEAGLWRCLRFRAATVTPNPASPTGPPGWGHAVIGLEFTFRRLAATGA